MSPVPALLLSIFFMQILWSLGSTAEERRSDVRAVLGEATEPGFWPTRGRRSGGGFPEDFPLPLFWLQHNQQLLPVPLSDTQLLQRYASDPRYGPAVIKDNNQIKSWMRS